MLVYKVFTKSDFDLFTTNEVTLGSFIDLKQIRHELSMHYHAEMTCPVVTGISLRIISEAAFEEYQVEQNLDSITPFWRVVNPESKLAGKLACGVDFIIKHQIQEGIEL